MRTALLTLLGMLLIAGSVSSTHAETTLGDGEYVIFYHHDLLGSPTLVTDEHGNTLWHEHSDPYGRAQDRVSETGEEFLHDRTGTRKGYTGHLQDEGTDLVYMKARYYDPQIGRFYSNDPVRFMPSSPMMFNRYAYANNNPYRYIDPDGRYADTVIDVAFATYDAGRAVGAAAAWGVGKVTGNKALSDIAGEGFSSAAGDLGVSIGMAVVPGLNAGMVRAGQLVPDGAVPVTKDLLGINAKVAKTRTNTDLGDVTDPATAKSIFRNQTKGQKISQSANENGDIRRTADDGTQIRMNNDGSTRIDLPGRGTQRDGETVHLNP